MNKISIPIGRILGKFREKSGLSQTEVAKGMGLSTKSGCKYISRLEKGLIRKSYLETVLVYLDAIGVSWETFFRELSALKSKQNHQAIMSQVKLPSDVNHKKKLDRDIRLYETKIKPPQNYYTKVDIKLVKQKIEKKVRAFCQNLQIKEDLIPRYLNFAYEILTATKYTPIIKKYSVSGISEHYLTRIMNIAVKTHHTEEKKVQKQKPIRLEKARAMAIKYLQSRVKLAPVETEISKLLEEYNLKDNVLYNSYMNFGRECFSKIRKFHIKNPLLLKQHLTEITRAWLRSGLKPEIMEKIKETILKHFTTKDNI